MVATRTRSRNKDAAETDVDPVVPAKRKGSPKKRIPKKVKNVASPETLIQEITTDTDFEKPRCQWSKIYTGASEASYVQYHDTEWGVPCTDDTRLMEYLVLDGAQCGLSWATILAKRRNYAIAFKHWDINEMAQMGEEDVNHLLHSDSGIVKHRGKIYSAITNAQVVLEIQKEFGSLATYLWGLMPSRRPIINQWKTMSEVPSSSELAKEISKVLKKRGFKFVGPTMVYAFMQAAGFVNDHTVDCFRYTEINKMIEDFVPP